MTTYQSTVREITCYLDQLLEHSGFPDIAYNGLQIDSGAQDVSRIAFAVDGGLSIIEEAVRLKCQLLIVHHGVYWGRVEPLVGPMARKAKLCFTNGLSLYASHLPLDGHLKVGNGAEVAKFLGLQEVQPFFEYKGRTIGVRGTLPSRLSAAQIASRLAVCEGSLTPPLVLPFGKELVHSIAIATGSATGYIAECTQHGIDLLITGEGKQEAYHAAKEHSCSVICMGHYASETFGVRALERVLREHFRVDTAWISEPTGI